MLELKQLTGDQLRRIYRDYLKGVPKERLMKKYDISEDTFWEVVGLYAKKKHPNDVGNAQDILGPADLLVSPMDTGATATENPIIARNPKDLKVVPEEVIKEYDYNGPEEEARVKGGELSDHIAKRNADEAKDLRERSKEAIKENKENTDAIYTELAEISISETEARRSKAAEAAKAAPSPEDLRRLTREASEAQLIADQAAEANIDQIRIKHSQDNAERDQKMIEEGEKANEELLKKQDEARRKEAEERASDHDALRKEAERAGQELARLSGQASVGAGSGPDEGDRGGQDKAGSPVVGGRGPEGAGSDRPAPSNQGAGAGQAGQGDSSGRGNPDASASGGEAKQGEVSLQPGQSTTVKAVEKANTSPTAAATQANPVEPAKVEPDGLKSTDRK